MGFRNGLAARRVLGLAFLCGAAAALMLHSAVCHAQQAAGTERAGPVAGGATGDATSLEEVVVTAQKRVESAQEIPKTVEVLNQGALARAGVTNLQDLSLISPSIRGTASPGSPPAIRGISSFAFSIGVQAQTGVVLDDVPQPNFSTL